MAFFFDRISGKSGGEQYANYLDNEVYINELKRSTHDVINYQLIEVRRAIAENSEKERNCIEASVKTMCGTLENGFKQIENSIGDIDWRLNEVNEQLTNISALLDWKTDLIIEEQKLTNFYLGNIELLLNKPESAKESSRYSEKGISHLINAIEEGSKSSYYESAYKNFSKAYDLDDEDFICLQKMGIIHLNSQERNNPEIALRHFKKSAFYSRGLANTTNSNFNKTFLHSFTKEMLLKETAMSLNYASRCCYILNDINQAILLVKQALELIPHDTDFLFQFAKCLCANNQAEEAITPLTIIVRVNKIYILKIYEDRDVNSKALVLEMLANLSHQLAEEIQVEVIELRNLKIINEEYRSQLQNIGDDIFSHNYFDLLVISELLFGVSNKIGLSGLIRLDASILESEEKKEKERIERDNLANKERFEQETKLRQEKEIYTKERVITISTLAVISIIIWLIPLEQRILTVIMRFISLILVIIIGGILGERTRFERRKSIDEGVVAAVQLGLYGAMSGAIIGFINCLLKWRFDTFFDTIGWGAIIGIVISALYVGLRRENVKYNG